MSVIVPSLAEAILEYHRVERARKEAAAAAFGIHDVPVLPRALQLLDHIAGTCRQAVRTAKTLEDLSISAAGAVPSFALATTRTCNHDCPARQCGRVRRVRTDSGGSEKQFASSRRREYARGDAESRRGDRRDVEALKRRL